jgi:hypothetical protein
MPRTRLPAGDETSEGVKALEVSETGRGVEALEVEEIGGGVEAPRGRRG